jgi:hypothetical protein
MEDEICGTGNAHGRGEKCTINSGRKPEGRRPLERYRQRWNTILNWVLKK